MESQLIELIELFELFELIELKPKVWRTELQITYDDGKCDRLTNVRAPLLH